VFKQNLNPSPLGTSSTLIFLKKRIRNEKVMGPKVKGVKNSKKNKLPPKHYKLGQFLNTQKENLYVALFLLLELKDDL
jgi:hypothetical protein